MRSRIPAMKANFHHDAQLAALDPNVEARALDTCEICGKSDFGCFGTRREAGTREQPSLS
jgi:hypothetical protein